MAVPVRRDLPGRRGTVPLSRLPFFRSVSPLRQFWICHPDSPSPIWIQNQQWCSGGDLNPHALRHTPLKRTCLPFHHPSNCCGGRVCSRRRIPASDLFHKVGSATFSSCLDQRGSAKKFVEAGRARGSRRIEPFAQRRVSHAGVAYFSAASESAVARQARGSSSKIRTSVAR